MQSVATSESNVRLISPEGWDQAKLGVTDLYATKVEMADGVPGFRSFWKPSQEDLDILNGGGVVQLCILGDNHPPVSVDVAEVRKVN